ncbi:MAG TPA: PTS sugar transporter subunit IIA [Polyangiaceae bacterium]|jgi:PTS system nitrogen regulatory IIA component
MRLSDILTADRILVDSDGGAIHDKDQALRLLAGLISPGLGVTEQKVEKLLMDRERLQSTGIGDGVAIPHSACEDAARQAAALLLCRQGVEFAAIDGVPVKIIFGVLGPKRATGEHLKTLARISRLLRDASVRSKLVASENPEQAFQLIQSLDQTLG